MKHDFNWMTLELSFGKLLFWPFSITPYGAVQPPQAPVAPIPLAQDQFVDIPRSHQPFHSVAEGVDHPTTHLQEFNVVCSFNHWLLQQIPPNDHFLQIPAEF